MKKKLLIILGSVFGLIVVIFIGLSLYVKSYLQSDKLKALIIPMVEEATGRKVDIEAINVSIFSGISMLGIHVKGKDGAADFAAIREFVLNYDLMPLLSKKLVISSLKVIDPSLNVTRDGSGKFNYEDIVAAFKASSTREVQTGPKPKTEGGMPFSVIADKIAIVNAKLEFIDAKKELPRVMATSDADLKVSAGTEPGALKFSGKLQVKSLDITMGNVATRTAGTIDVTPEEVTYALNTVIGSDTIAASGTIQDYMTVPEVRLDLYAKQLDLEKFMSMSDGARPEEKKLKKGFHVSEAGDGVISGPEKRMDIKAAGNIKVDTAHYKGNTMKNLLVEYHYSGGVATIDPLSLNFANGDKVDISGHMKGNLGFRYSSDKGSASDQIKQTLIGKMIVDMDKVQVKESKLTDAVATFTGLDDLRRPSFDKGHFDINIQNERVLLSGLMSSPRLKVAPSGTIGFNQTLALLTDIEVSPEIAAKMRVARFTGFMDGKDGWTLIPLKITGTSDNPTVGANQATLRKQLQKGIQGEIEKRLFKDGSQQQQQKKQDEKRQDLLKGLLGK